MQQKLSDPRIQSMYSGDRLWAYAAVLVLWLSYAFTFWQVALNSSDNGVFQALAIAGGLVLLFNTASIAAMINHYDDDRDHIYGLDIHYLDEMKKSR
ncbi:MAG: hypothetical protein AB7S70_14845 [Hyphomicrobium sp.]|uniref:hypothetical protein n=1 Tax=Hyphomicrobium sp. TaxID=82 RepID=UPI003D0F851B